MDGWWWRLVTVIGCVMAAPVLEGGVGGDDLLLRTWTTQDGLPHDHVRALLWARDGFLWVGTDSGLARFDGREFRNYGPDEGLGAVGAFSLMEGSDGAVWVGTLGGGISVIRNSRVVRTYGPEDGLPGSTFSLLAEDGEGRVWASGSDGTACFEDGGWREVRATPESGPLNLRTLAKGPDGVIWGVFPNGELNRMAGGKWEPLVGNGRGPRQLTSVMVDSHGRPWAAGHEGMLWRGSDDGWEEFPLPENITGGVVSLAEAPDGRMWMIVHHSGLLIFRDGEWSLPRVRDWHGDDSVRTVITDPEGRIWLGTSSGGLHALVRTLPRVRLVDASDPKRAANRIGCLLDDGAGRLLLGSQGKGLYQADDSGVESLADGDSFSDSLFLNALTRDREGAVWAATSRGVFKRLDGQWVMWPDNRSSPYNAWDLAEDVDSGMWVGTGRGQLYFLNEGAVEQVDYGADGTAIKGLAQQEDGTVWVGTRGNGLFRGRHGGTWTRLGREHGLGSEIIRTVVIGPGGQPWVGTMGGGFSIGRGDAFHSITTREGLPDNTVSQFHFDDVGRLWVGTNRGVAVFSAHDVEIMTAGGRPRLHPVVIDHFDGLISEEFTITPPVRTEAGHLVFATTKGYFEIDPGAVVPDSSSPRVMIESVIANGREIFPEGTRAIELAPGSERLEVRFTSPYFGNPKRLKFRNRLIGVERDWNVESSLNFAEYRNLAPGRYRFEVEATHGNGLWSQERAVVDLVLKPYWWQRAWFRVLAVGLLAVGLAVVLHVAGRRKVKARIQDLRRRQAVHEERARIARDLHDDVGAGLTQVALLGELVARNLKRDPDRAAGQVDEIFITANELTRALDEIVWAASPEQDTLEGFMAFLGTHLQRFCDSSGLKGRIDVESAIDATSLDPAVRHHLYLASKEVLHNTVKHSGATEVTIRVGLIGNRIRLEISDNGRGFERQDRSPDSGEDGLRNIRHRMKEIGGECSMESLVGAGTRVEMRVPLRTGRRER